MNDEERGLATRRLCSWIDAHLERFRPASAARPGRLREVKPLAELALILYSITGHTRGEGGLAAWARAVGERLFTDIEALGGRLSWDAFGERGQSPELLLPFPVLERVTGRISCHHDAVLGILGSGAASLPVAFAREVAGIADARALLTAHLEAALSDWGGGPGPVRTSWLYGVTHALFYATGFGRRPLPLTEDHTAALASIAAARIAARRHDIAAELLLALACAGAPATPPLRQTLDALTAVAAAEGSISTDPDIASGDAFGDRYHATIVTLGALAAADFQWRAR